MEMAERSAGKLIILGAVYHSQRGFGQKISAPPAQLRALNNLNANGLN
jgi:hypothetical protein